MEYLSRRLAEMTSSSRAWMVTALCDAGIPPSHPLIQQAAELLVQKQEPDGRWQSEDGAQEAGQLQRRYTEMDAACALRLRRTGGIVDVVRHAGCQFPERGHLVGLTDLIAHPHLGGKTLLFMIDHLYGAATQVTGVVRYQSLGNHWSSSLFLSQDPVAIDSVGLDFVRNEPAETECRGCPENYLHEAALAVKPPSGTVYDPSQGGKAVASLGVHEHWNNAKDKKYSRNLGTGQGIELVAVD